MSTTRRKKTHTLGSQQWRLTPLLPQPFRQQAVPTVRHAGPTRGVFWGIKHAQQERDRIEEFRNLEKHEVMPAFWKVYTYNTVYSRIYMIYNSIYKMIYDDKYISDPQDLFPQIVAWLFHSLLWLSCFLVP